MYPHADRIFGVETEFGCLVMDEDLGRPEDIVEAIKDHLFFERSITMLVMTYLNQRKVEDSFAMAPASMLMPLARTSNTPRQSAKV